MVMRVVTAGGDFSYRNAKRINQNFSEIDDKLLGWEDLRFPAAAINPLGAVSDPDLELTGVFTGTYLFDQGSTEVIAGQAQLPHAMKTGSMLYPHVHWCPTTTNVGNVRWRMGYIVADMGEVFPAAYTVLDTTGPTGGIANMHRIVYFEPVDSTGMSLSAMLIWKISRLGGDVLDTYPADARLLEFDIHYQVDEVGSSEQGAK